MTATDEVGQAEIVIDDDELAIIVTLDRPRALNALTTDMVRAIKACVDGADLPVVIRSAHPTAFCAGGDIRAIREHSLAGDHAAITEIFGTEYAMNLAISESDPPVVSIVDGTCMGGGIGISGHSRVHVVTERAALAMPESAIGFFPDVGTSHLLANAPGGVGLYLGMTGARISAADAIYSGLATHVMAADDVTDFIGWVRQWGVAAALAQFARSTGGGAGTLVAHRADIDRCFLADTVDEVVDRVSETQNDWGTETSMLLRAASPQSLETAFALIRWARGRSLADCLHLDLDVAEAMVRTPDFLEGVGAKLVDKNRSPAWTSRLGEPPVGPIG